MASDPIKAGDSDEAGNQLPAVRQARLAELIRARGQVAMADLISLFGVSRDTIRRDLNILEDRGVLVKTHGGAMAADRLVDTNTSLSSRMDSHQEAKERIGRLAATLVRDGETLMLNGGSSVTYFASALAERRELTIVTNNLRVLPALPPQSLRKTYVLGGVYVASSQVTVDFDGFSDLPRISVDTAVISVTGMSGNGCFIGKLDEALATRDIIRTCRRTILLADSSKFDVEAFAHVGDYSRIELLVSDAMPNGRLAHALAQAAVKIIVAE